MQSDKGMRRSYSRGVRERVRRDLDRARRDFDGSVYEPTRTLEEREALRRITGLPCPNGRIQLAVA